LQSSSFDSATWTKGALTVTANNAISPSGVQDSDLVTANGANTQHYVLQTVSAGAKTYSVFAKMGTQRYIQILTSGTAAPVANFDLQDGVANMSGSNSTASIEDYGNGWWRCILQTNDGLAGNFYINYASSITMGRFGATTSSGTLYLWGAQAEVGSYPTSYIPTTSASVTRNADVISKTGISSLIGQTEGTMFLDFTSESLNSNFHIFSINDGTANNRIIIYVTNTNTIAIRIRVAGASQTLIQTSTITANTNYKCAIAYKLNDVVFYVNGSQVGSYSSLAIPTCSVLANNDGAGADSFHKPIKAAALWKTRLTNDELATLTTL